MQLICGLFDYAFCISPFKYLFNFIKLKIPTDNPAIIPIEIKAPLKKDDSDIAGRNVKAAKIIKTIFAAMIDTKRDIETLNIPLEIILLFSWASIENCIFQLLTFRMRAAMFIRVLSMWWLS